MTAGLNLLADLIAHSRAADADAARQYWPWATLLKTTCFTVPTDPSTSPHNPRPSSARPAAFYQGPLLQVRTPPQHEDRRNVYPQQERG